MFKKKGMATATHECSVFIISISLPSISCHKDLGNTKATSQDGSFFFLKFVTHFSREGGGSFSFREWKLYNVVQEQQRRKRKEGIYKYGRKRSWREIGHEQTLGHREIDVYTNTCGVSDM